MTSETYLDKTCLVVYEYDMFAFSEPNSQTSGSRHSSARELQARQCDPGASISMRQ